MSELRKDPIVSRWVIISEERSKRPSDFAPDENKKKMGHCPFCEGHEHHTPSEVLAYRHSQSESNKPGWFLRVVPNKFPALQIEGDLNSHGEGMFDRMNGIGAHEVIIETPDHQKDLTDLNRDEFQKILFAYRDRIADLKKDSRFKYILIFKNHGSAAGATVEHTHSQLIATPVIPKTILEELRGTKNHYDTKERCVYCDMIRQEADDPIRKVVENEKFIALEPFASRFPFETWILPKHHQAHFESEPENHYMLLGEIFSETLKRLRIALDNPSYNYVLHTSPVNQKEDANIYHWHIEIMPKLTKVAGFEWGSGFFINPTPPEQAAEYLKQIKIH